MGAAALKERSMIVPAPGGAARDPCESLQLHCHARSRPQYTRCADITVELCRTELVGIATHLAGPRRLSI